MSEGKRHSGLRRRHGARATLINGKGDRDAADSLQLKVSSASLYRGHFSRFVELEERTERNACKELWEQPEAKLADEGLCISGLQIDFLSRSETVIEAALPLWPNGTKKPLPSHHVFLRGDVVRLSASDDCDRSSNKVVTSQQEKPAGKGSDLASPVAIDGTVIDVGPTSLLIELEHPGQFQSAMQDSSKNGRNKRQPNLATQRWRLDRGFSTVTFQRMLDGLQALDLGGSNSQVLDFVVSSHPACAASGPHARQLELRSPGDSTSNVKRGGTDEDVSRILGCASKMHLNSSQKEAVLVAAQNRITVLQGPPGTGKTQTCAALVAALAQAQRGVSRVLACAFNNVAVDELSKRIAALGGASLQIVRLGEPARSDPEAQALALASIEGEEASELRKALEFAQAEVDKLRKDREEEHVRGEAALAEAREAEAMVEAIWASKEEALRAKEHELKTQSQADEADEADEILWLERQLARVRSLGKSQKSSIPNDPNATRVKKMEAALKEAREALLWRSSKRRGPATDADTSLKWIEGQHKRAQILVAKHKHIAAAAFHRRDTADATAAQHLNKIWVMERRLKEIRAKILENADVVCCTCIGAGGADLNDLSFSTVLIDESAQAVEPAVILPLLKLEDTWRTPARLILAGDHRQLPPTILSAASRDRYDLGSFSKSLFERMMDLMTTRASAAGSRNTAGASTGRCLPGISMDSLMLTEQYRMHPDISAFPSKQFYKSKLQNAIRASQRDLPDVAVQEALQQTGIHWTPSTPRAFFVNIDGLASRSVDHEVGKSRINTASAALVRHVVHALVESGAVQSTGDIGVITPYAKQRMLLSGVPNAPGSQSHDMVSAPPLPRGVEIRTVDGFQGCEKEIVILDTVRSNGDGLIGFLKDERRLNVGITRARRLMIVLGSCSTLRLSAHEAWGSLLDHFHENGALISISEMPTPCSNQTDKLHPEEADTAASSEGFDGVCPLSEDAGQFGGLHSVEAVATTEEGQPDEVPVQPYGATPSVFPASAQLLGATKQHMVIGRNRGLHTATSGTILACARSDYLHRQHGGCKMPSDEKLLICTNLPDVALDPQLLRQSVKDRLGSRPAAMGPQTLAILRQALRCFRIC